MPYQIRDSDRLIDVDFASLTNIELEARRKPEPDEAADPRSVSLGIEVEKSEDRLVVIVDMTRESRLAFSRVKMLAVFRSANKEILEDISDEAVLGFADETVTVALWPYLRENLLRLTGQLGIKPMTLPLRPPTLPYKEALERGDRVVSDANGTLL